MLQTFSWPICSEESGSIPFSSDKFADSNSPGSLEVGLGPWKCRALSILKVGAEELRSMILKVFLFLSLYLSLSLRMTGFVFLRSFKSLHFSWRGQFSTSVLVFGFPWEAIHIMRISHHLKWALSLSANWSSRATTNSTFFCTLLVGSNIYSCCLCYPHFNWLL